MNSFVIRLTIALVALALSTNVLTATARASTSVIDDPIGDSQATSPYLDIVKSKITLQEGQDRLFFMIEVAAAIPDAPAESFASWSFAFGNPATFVGGATFDYAVAVRWSNGSLQGLLVDRTSGQVVFTPLAYEIDGATIKWHVDLAQIGNPSVIKWDSAARLTPAGQPFVGDRAPDFGLGFGLWTR